MEGLLQDVRYAVRTLRKSPGFVAVTLLTLALGIGANVAIFAVVNAVLLQPLPFRDPERLVRIYDDFRGAGARDVGMSIPELQDLQSSDVFSQVSALFPASVAIGGGDRVERGELLGTSANYFDLLGAKPALGRVYTQADWTPGFQDGVVISDALWRREFGADPKVIGRRVRADEDGYTIIGVMPPEFRHPGSTLSGDVDIWAGAGMVANPFPNPPVRAARFLPGAVGRLKEGLSVEEAQKRVDVLVAKLKQTYTEYPAAQGWALRLEPVQSSFTRSVRPTLLILLAAISFVLLIVCVNVASLMLARSSGRMREFSVRQALGASPSRLARQVLTESVLVSLVGGACAVGVLALLQHSLVAAIPADIPRINEVHIDWKLVSFALVLSLATGILFGLMPALSAGTADPNRGLKEGGRSGDTHRVRRSRAALVVSEVALTIVLLVGAGLLVRSFSAVLGQDPGFDAVNPIAGQIWVPVPNNPEANRYLTLAKRSALARALLAELSGVAGMQSVALGTVNDIPLSATAGRPVPFSLPDEATTQEQNHSTETGAVSARYFDVLRVPLKQGRVFTDFDDEKAPLVVVVNESFVRRFSPQKSVVGRQFRVGRSTDFEIVGVVGDVHNDALDVAPEPHVYLSILQRPPVALSVFARSRWDVNTTRDAITKAVHKVDPELPVFGVHTMPELMSESIAKRRFALFLMSAFAVSALLLAGLGIYGVVAFVVGQRDQEFGLRVALGATSKDIMQIALSPGLRLTAIGLAIGLAVSLVMSRLMSTLLFGVSAADPITLVSVAVLLGLVAVIAGLVPARRATRASPMQALKAT